MNKKGFEQIYVYIFVIIVVAITFVVGFKAINALKEKQSQVELISFYNDLDREVKKFYNADYLSADDITLNLPSSIKKVCFTTDKIDINLNSFDITSKAIMQNKYGGTSRKNVFIFPDTAAKPNQGYYFIKNLEVSQNPLCIQTKSGSLSFTLQNKGEVYIS
ncbi:hypothetical protein J4403_04805 [Candidatus Woesearchaeota archaeon]|nr:hypothetical protein [Candidatus Woesearchaeota archaeon]